MNLILHIETSAEICSVALSNENLLLAVEDIREPYQHASQLTLSIQSILKDTNYKLSQLKAVALSHGPGSYTGLRIGASVAKGICYALDKPLIAVSTLKSIARAANVADQDNVLYFPMIDARRQEVYTALYDATIKEMLPPHPLILNKANIQPYLDYDKKIILTGNGAQKGLHLFHENDFEYIPTPFSAKNLVFDACEALRNKDFQDFVYYKPLYLKPPNITKPKIHVKK